MAAAPSDSPGGSAGVLPTAGAAAVLVPVDAPPDPVGANPAPPAADASHLLPPDMALASLSNGLAPAGKPASAGGTKDDKDPTGELVELKAHKAELEAELKAAEEAVVGSDQDVKAVDGWPAWRNRLRSVMRFPGDSKLGVAVAAWSNFTVILSVIMMIINSQPAFRQVPGDELERKITFWVMFGINCSFTVELVLNWLAMRNVGEFLSFFSILDILTTLPFWLVMGLAAASGGDATTSNYIGLSILRVLRLARLVKIFSTNRSVKIVLLWQAIRESSFGIAALLVVFTLVMIFYGTLVYYAESASCIVDPVTGLWIYNDALNNGTVSKFQSIETSLYFMSVTLTTVGYGDITPVTAQGRFVACLAMITGLFVLAMPMTIISNSYSRVLDRFQVSMARIAGIKDAIRHAEWRICEIEGRPYRDPFKRKRRGKVSEWWRGVRARIWGGDPTPPPAPPGSGPELVDPDSEEVPLEAEPEVPPPGGDEEVKRLLERSEERAKEAEARLRSVEERLGRVLGLLEAVVAREGGLVVPEADAKVEGG
ncbi:hypothetical protein DFJ74DRAFT_709500 [Hyaloraphidium curvatum]|nr:hypothetical protein DFJ74DRAFT_709500 [Hyaloraphidium curvatum]